MGWDGMSVEDIAKKENQQDEEQPEEEDLIDEYSNVSQISSEKISH